MTTDTDTATTTATATELLAAATKLLPAARTAYDADGNPAGVIYFAAETRLWYAVGVADLAALVEGRSHDWYSEWCADSAPVGEGGAADDAASDAGWRL